MMNRIIFSMLAAVAAIVLYSMSAAFAQSRADWPTKSLRLIVGAPAGSTVDILGRLAASKLAQTLGHQVIVDNRPGAAGNLGAELAAKSAPDGYTLLIITAAHAISVSLYSRLGYDLERDFSPVSLLSLTSFVLVVNPSLPIRSVKELLKLAKSKPGQLAFASAGNGSPPHLAGELFKSMAGVDIVHVPYRGDAPASTDVLSGHVPMMFMNIVLAMPNVRAGKLRALAVTGSTRAAVIPDVPTIAESGLAGYQVNGWWGILVPKETPAGVVARLSADLASIMRMPEVKERLEREGSEPVGSSPAQFAAHIKAEIGKWTPVVKASGARVD